MGEGLGGEEGDGKEEEERGGDRGGRGEKRRGWGDINIQSVS